MAEGLFKKIVKDRNINDVQCNSCGIYAYSGDMANENAIAALREYDVNIENHRSRPFDPCMADETDIFVCMTDSHAQVLKGVLGKVGGKKIIVPGGGVPDPYGGDIEIYRSCAEKIYNDLLVLADALFCQIVPMDESSVDGIAEIENQCFSAPWSVESIKEELNNDNAHFLIAKSDDKFIGYIGVHEIVGEAYIANVAVLPLYRGFGVASRLMGKAEIDAKNRGCEFISLEVRPSNENAISLYKKRGYETVGERKNFYSNPTENGLIMTKYFNLSKNIDR